MGGRDELAAVLHDAGCGCREGATEGDISYRDADAILTSPALARLLDEARREALREAADNIHEVSGHSAGVPVWRSQVADWLNERADRGGDDG